MVFVGALLIIVGCVWDELAEVVKTIQKQSWRLTTGLWLVVIGIVIVLLGLTGSLLGEK